MAATILPIPTVRPAYSIQEITQDNISISATTYLNGTISAAKTGYEPIAIVGVYFENATSSGARYTYVDCVCWELDGTTVNYRLYNHNSNAAKVKMHVHLLYVS